MNDPFATLGVSKQAGDEEIKKAYKKLAKELHPDKNPGNKEKEEKFKHVKEAYEKIKNAKAREEYEQEVFARQYGGRPGGKTYQNAGDPFGGFQGFNFRGSQGEEIDPDILNEIFGSFGMGGGFGQSRSRSGKRRNDETASIQLTFWEAVTGGPKLVALPNGSKMQIKIPAGIKDGQKIRLKDQASKINPLSNGDLLLEAKVLSDERARREGNNIILEQDVPVDVAVSGGGIDVSCPLGNFNIKLPEYTNSGKKFRLKGKGIHGGDLYVKVNLVLPESRKQKIQELFKNRAA